MSVAGAFIVPHPPIIFPEIGAGEEEKISATINAYRSAAKLAAALKPDTVVISSPHTQLYADYFHISPGRRAVGDMGAFGAPEVRIEADYDTEFVKALAEEAESAGLRAGTLGEKDPSLDHGTMIPLRFLNEVYTDYRLVRIGLSGFSALEHYRMGRCVAAVSEKLGRGVVYIASGDLSHKLREDGPYGFAAEGPQFDSEVTRAMSRGDFLTFLGFDEDFCDRAAECGLRSFIMMAGALDGRAVSSQLLSYEGPFGVGYAVASFMPRGGDSTRKFGKTAQQMLDEKMQKIRAGEDELVRLARLSLETYIKTGEKAKLPSGLPEELLKSRKGAFVSIKKDGSLRGCIGTIEPEYENLAYEIINNAVSAGTDDPRFGPVTAGELGSLVYSVDVLGAPERIESPAQLDTKKYGVIVTSGYRRGLLLPNLEGIDDVNEQISIALRKAGIRESEKYTLERFEAVRHT
jgi:AmmeMemoRadiSam system protein A/AmmeMemoRadiSam system protein B